MHCFVIVQMARELTISNTNNRLGLLPMKWQDTLDAPKLPGEVDLVPNEVCAVVNTAPLQQSVIYIKFIATSG